MIRIVTLHDRSLQSVATPSFSISTTPSGSVILSLPLGAPGHTLEIIEDAAAMDAFVAVLSDEVRAVTAKLLDARRERPRA